MENISLIKRIVNNRIIHHSLFWVINIAFFIFIFKSIDDDKGFYYHFSRLSIILVFIAISVYYNLLYLIPKFLKTKKFLKYTLFQLINIAVFSFCKIFTKLYLFKDEIDENMLEEISSAIGAILLYLVLTTFLKFFREWSNYQNIVIKLKETEKEKLAAELNSLKAQLNPHFMFNTLNNIYSLSLDKSDKTPELILKLSDLMSYTLYDCKEKFVPIKKEIEFIKNYLELEKIRIEEKIDIQLNINNNFDGKNIAPLLFVPLIENAFKHGINKHPENSYLYINFFNIDNKLKFTVKNSLNSDLLNYEYNAKGIGIENVKKRLELIYPERHKLNITKKENSFLIELEIEFKPDEN